MPISMLPNEIALAAFRRRKSLMGSPLARSLRKSLLTRWKKPDTTQRWTLAGVRVTLILAASGNK